MRVWTVSEAKAGTVTQCLGVAQRIDPDPVVKKIGRLPRWRRTILSPYAFLRVDEPGLVVSCGIFAERHVAAIRWRFGGRPVAVHLQPPAEASSGVYDLAFVSRHDRHREKLAGTLYREMIGVPHRITRDLLATRRDDARRQRAITDGERVVTVLVGGSNGAYVYDAQTIERLAAAVADLARTHDRVLVSTSRRTAPELLSSLLVLRSDRVDVWNREGENPYLDFLASADAFVVTKDTVTMQCEALTTGQPVYVFDLAKVAGPKLDKFEWFHDDMLNTLALTRRYEPALPTYEYVYENQAESVAREIRAFISARGDGAA